MKGSLKALKRLPQQSMAKVGMASKSNDVEFDELSRHFSILEEHSGKLSKDSKAFRDSVQGMLSSSTAFSTALSTVFKPIGTEADLSKAYPEAAVTIDHITQYEEDMAELKQMIDPELELIDTRVLQPVKEFAELVKKVRKAITKREHKLVDYDRFNNSYTKLRDKKDKSLKDEQNLFKLEQQYEAAANEYNHHNDLLKQELPIFLEKAQALVTPLQQSFYYMQLGILYNMLEKFNGFAKDKYDLTEKDITGIHTSRWGNSSERLESLTITKKLAPTAKLLAGARSTSGSERSSIASRTPSTTAESAPPPYTPSSTVSAAPGKRAPPPPPPPAAKNEIRATAIYAFEGQQDGDLSFQAGDIITVVKQTPDRNDWWTGQLNGKEGIFPGTYVQI